MRSSGVLCDKDGQVKRTWTWQDPTRGGAVFLPVEDGDECILIDLDHPLVPDEPHLGNYHSREEILQKFSEETRSHLKISIPHRGKAEHFFTTNLTIVKRHKGSQELPTAIVPQARIERVGHTR